MQELWENSGNLDCTLSWLAISEGIPRDQALIIGKSHHEVSGTCSQLLLVSSMVVSRVRVRGNGVIIEIE